MSQLIKSRAESLIRRAESLPAEIEQWLEFASEGRRFERNFSQIEALDVFMQQVNGRVNKTVEEIKSAVNISGFDPSASLIKSNELLRTTQKAQRVWGYFRTKLEQRLIPQYEGALIVSDLICYDCYQSIRQQLERLDIPHMVGERAYPLTFLFDEEVSPVTWTRTSQIYQLDLCTLPIPVVAVPWDQTANPWELVALHHEVSHDVDFDINSVSKEFGQRLEEKLSNCGTPMDRTITWYRWVPEIFADFLGVQLAGPPFVQLLAGLLVGPAQVVCKVNENGVHPASYIRVLLCDRLARRYSSPYHTAILDQLLTQWQALYKSEAKLLVGYQDDFDVVIETFVETPLNVLTGAGLQFPAGAIAEFSSGEAFNQVEACMQFLAGEEPSVNVTIRSLPGAALMAINQHPNDQKFVHELVDHLRKSVENRAPPGQLALRSEKSKQYLRILADIFMNSE